MREIRHYFACPRIGAKLGQLNMVLSQPFPIMAKTINYRGCLS
jgi:hypothetical protein